MEDFNILNSLNNIKEQIYLDFNTMNSLNNYLDSIILSNQNKKFSKTITLLNEDSQKKAEEFQKENQILQNRIKKLEEIIQNNKIENQNLLNASDNYLKIIEQQKETINNLKDEINLKQECSQIIEENNNFILNNYKIKINLFFFFYCYNFHKIFITVTPTWNNFFP